MAIRVRKVVKESNRSAVEVLGVLHAIGFERYRSLDDMLPDPVVERLRRAWKDGVRPIALPRELVAALQRPAGSDAGGLAPAEDIMTRLVPGVSPQVRGNVQPRRPEPVVARAVPQVDAPARNIAVDRAPNPAERSAWEAERAAMVAERSALEQERAAMAAERAVLDEHYRRIEADRAAIEEQRAALASDRAALANERAWIASQRAELAESRSRGALASTSPLLTEVLAERGLRGVDEYERALGALAQTRQLADLLVRWRVDDAPMLVRALKERVLLSAGPVADSGHVAVVNVAPERAEVPEQGELARRVSRLGETLLLNGLRRVLIVGGRPLGQKALRSGMDARIELRFLPPATRRRAEAENDVLRTDAVVLWGVDADAEAREVYSTSRALLIEVAGADLVHLLTGVEAALTAG